MDYKSVKLSDNCTELHCALIFDSQQDAAEKLASLASDLADEDARLLTVELFAPLAYSAPVEKFKATLDAQNAPTMHVLPLDEDSSPVLAGAHVIALKGADVEFKQSPSGSKAAVYKTGDAEYCRILGVALPDNGGDSDKYTEKNFEELDATLSTCGFKFSDIARTWFYNCDILGWYAGCNEGRTRFFHARNVFKGLLPASTGIGAPNPSGVRIQSGLIAVKGGALSGKVFEVESPLQCGAPNYGSSFSRAVEMDYAGGRRIMVSGTASIDPQGNTLYYGEIDAQIELTMQVIEGILKSRGLSFADVHRAVVYCMNPKFYAAFQKWASRNVSFPHVPAYNTVCRSDLMFEVELDAFGE